MPFSEKSLAVPWVEIILNPSSLKSRAKVMALILSESFTEIKTEPVTGNEFPAPDSALA